MISNPVTGAQYFLQGFKLINLRGIRRYVVIPLLINILIFSAALWFALSQFNVFIAWALSGLPVWLNWLEWVMWPLFTVTFGTVVFFGFSIMANIISAPFNGPLAAALERHLTGNTTTAVEKTFIEECKDSIGNEFLKLKYALYLMLPLLFLSLLGFAFPLITPVISLLWLLYSIWILTLEYADFPMANHGMAFLHIREKLAEKRLLSLGFGSMVMLATLIPLINFVVMPVAVAGATLMYLNEYRNQT